MKNVNEFKNKDTAELQRTLLDLKKKLADTRFRLSANEMKNAPDQKKMKKDIARILTVLNSK